MWRMPGAGILWLVAIVVGQLKKVGWPGESWAGDGGDESGMSRGRGGKKSGRRGDESGTRREEAVEERRRSIGAERSLDVVAERFGGDGRISKTSKCSARRVQV